MNARARGVVLALAIAAACPAASGCEIVEANVQALDTLGRSSATDGEKAYATVVVAGTLTVIAGLAVAASIAGIEMGGDDPGPPEVVIVDELGWGFTRCGDEARWFRCTSRLLCTHDEVVEPAEAVLDVVPAGRGQPLALGGAVGEDVDLVAIRVRRRR